MKKYEGMFLIDAKQQKRDPEESMETIKALVKKCDGEVIELFKWDERKMAYEIKDATNGVYYLSYFSGQSDTVQRLNREIELTSDVLRALFLSIKEVPDINKVKQSFKKDAEEGEAPEGEDETPDAPIDDMTEPVEETVVADVEEAPVEEEPKGDVEETKKPEGE